MYVNSALINIRLQCINSLKEKRQIARSVMDKARNKFNASIAEVAENDTHSMLVIGISIVASSLGHGQKCIDEIIRFIEEFVEINGYGEVVQIEYYE